MSFKICKKNLENYCLILNYNFIQKNIFAILFSGMKCVYLYIEKKPRLIINCTVLNFENNIRYYEGYDKSIKE